MNVDTGKLVNGEEMEELVQQMMKRMSVPHSEALRMVSTNVQCLSQSRLKRKRDF